MTKPILCVTTSHPIKGKAGIPTGFFLAELTHPLEVFEKAGYKTTLASVRGGQPPIDGFDLKDPVNAHYWNEYVGDVKGPSSAGELGLTPTKAIDPASVSKN
jgi:DJ-1/pfpI family protein